MTQAFLAKFVSEPQFMEPVAASALLASLRAADLASAHGAPMQANMSLRDLEVDDSRRYPVVSGVAVIPVVGTLRHRDYYSYWGSWNFRSYQSIADMIEDAVTDGNITAVLLDVDSPGGTASGCLDFAESIAKMRGVKPIWASVNETACSAAYAIASAADKIVLGKSGFVGSIGVVGMHIDISGALEKWGEKVTYLYAGAHKIDGAMELPLTDQARAAWMANIEGQYQRFCEVVATNRKMTVDAVRKTEAAIYRGEDALKIGLADEIMTQQEAIMALTSKTAPNGARLSAALTGGGSNTEGSEDMTTQLTVKTEPTQAEKDAAAALAVANAPADATMIANACQAGGHPELIADLLTKKPSVSAVQARVTEAQEIKQAATRAGLPGMSARLISAGVSLETAQHLLFDAKAAADGQVTTDTTHANTEKPAAAQINVQSAYNIFNGKKN